MKIIQVFHSRIQKRGSFEDYMIELAEQTNERGIGLGFIFPSIETNEVKDELERRNADVQVINADWNSFAFALDVIKIAKQNKPDCMDFHFCAGYNLVYLYLVLRLMGIQVIFHYHGEIRPIAELKLFNKHFSRLRAITFFTHQIICVSKANMKFLRALNIRKEIIVVYNGINLDNFNDIQIDKDFRTEMGFSKDDLIVTFIGSLIERKGIDILIRAAQMVVKDVPHAKFVIVGGGKKDKYDAMIKDLNLNQNVYLMGLIRDYPFHIMQTADLFVSASYAESFGLSIAEAELMGMPVVGTQVGGVPEVVVDGQTGYLVPSGNSEALAEKIIILLKDESLRKSFGLAGAKWVKENFGLRDRVKELLDGCVG